MKKSLIFIFLTAAFLLCSCNKSNNSNQTSPYSDSNVITSVPNGFSPSEEAEDEVTKWNGFTITMNFYQADEDGKETDVPVGCAVDINSETDYTFYVTPNIAAPSFLKEKPVTMAMCVLIDGVPTPFKTDGNEEMLEYYTVSDTKGAARLSIPVTVRVDQNTQLIKVLLYCYNDLTIDEDKEAEFTQFFTDFSIINTSFKDNGQEPEISEKHYTEKVSPDERQGGISLNVVSSEADGKFPYMINSPSDMVTSDTDIYLRFTGDNIADGAAQPDSMYYSILLFCDGKLLSSFDGKNYCFVHTHGDVQKKDGDYASNIPGDRLWECPVDVSGLSKGKHTFAAVAVPFYYANMIQDAKQDIEVAMVKVDSSRQTEKKVIELK